MKQSSFFTKTRKEVPADETAKNAKLLIQGGFIHKEMAGVYSYLPMGLMVLRNIEQVIREEMEKIGASEIEMSVLQDKNVWEASGRWDNDIFDVWFKSQLKSGADVGLGATYEEPITAMLTNFIHSYKDLPVTVYQIARKFRNEVRSKSGIMRGREFLMKDMYSFNLNKEAHDKFYESSKVAYMKVFNRLGIGDTTFLTFSSGGTFSKFSHEFQTLTVAGEDKIYLDRSKGIAVNEEVYSDELVAELGLNHEKLEVVLSAEVGNIFTLGTKFSEAAKLYYANEEGENLPVFMGSYGIGVSRLMGVIAEANSDNRGLVWPKEVAPFSVHILVIGQDQGVIDAAQSLYVNLLGNSVKVLLDNRIKASAGEKFNDSDLIGVPQRIVVSNRSLESGGVEYKRRTDKEGSIISFQDAIKRILDQE